MKEGKAEKMRSDTLKRTFVKGMGAVAGVALLGGLATACDTYTPSASNVATVEGNAPWMTTPSANSSSGPATVVNLTIENINTPEGSEPTYIGPNGKGAADLFSVPAGKEIQVVVDNKSAMPHTFTVAQLGLNIAIAPEATAKFTFTAKAAGTYSWYCSIPCGSWVMSHAGYMKGDFKVT